MEAQADAKRGMMYKDKDKQREANRAAKAKQRAMQGMTEGRRNVIPDVIPLLAGPRRGKDITKFEHLPPDVQGTINRLSGSYYSESATPQEHSSRTAITIDYQHKRPDRYYSTGTGEVG